MSEREGLREQVAKIVWENRWSRPDDPEEEHISWEYALEQDDREFGVEVFECRHIADRILALLAAAPREQGCTHDASEIISADEGTSYCGACEREAREQDPVGQRRNFARWQSRNTARTEEPPAPGEAREGGYITDEPPAEGEPWCHCRHGDPYPNPLCPMHELAAPTSEAARLADALERYADRSIVWMVPPMDEDFRAAARLLRGER